MIVISKSELSRGSLQLLRLFLDLQKKPTVTQSKMINICGLLTLVMLEKKKVERASEVQNKKGNTPVTTLSQSP